MSSTRTDLAARLRDLDGRSYGNYKQITGRYRFGPVTVFVDRVQVDPFASPSKVRVRIDRAEAGFPTDITSDGADRIAAADFLLRVGTRALADLAQRAISLGPPGQEILELTNVRIDDAGYEARLLASRPAKARRILGRQAADILTRNVPELARTMFLHSGLSAEDLRQHVQLHRDQSELR